MKENLLDFCMKDILKLFLFVKHYVNLFHDKYDLENCEEFTKRYREDQIHIKWIEVDKFSKLAEPILDHTAKYYSSPANLDKGILDLVKSRLENKTSFNLC